MGRKECKKNAGSQRDYSLKNQGGDMTGAQKFVKDKTSDMSQNLSFRKMVDPEIAKYFNEIANVIEGTEIDLEERSVICGNALEEASGKEVELATDYIISHTMQNLLEGCSVDQLCNFLRCSAKQFSIIAMDRSGSYVAETALKSLAMHIQDSNTRPLIEETLISLCQEIVANSVDIMCNCYGSHVLRRLLCLCKGVSVDSSEFHGTKSSAILAKRLSLKSSRLENDEVQYDQSFPNQLMYLISEMLDPSRVDIAVIQRNQHSSLVLQTALKLLSGHEEVLLRIIPILLGCRAGNELEGNLIINETGRKEILCLLEENAYSHLMEVILMVSPNALYNEILTKVFKDSMFKMTSHPSVNFVVQALISHARNHEHVQLIWEELGAKFRILFEMGRSGVVAALLATCLSLKIYEHKCCQALADAVLVANEPPAIIIPRILFVNSYFDSNDKVGWNWPNGIKMHVLGSLILQSVFKFPSEHVQVFIAGITSLEVDHVLEATKNPCGSRVIEAFLNSNASAKQKRKLVMKVQGHFGELSLHPSGSFVIDKFFNASNISLREKIVSELLPLQVELSKTKQGPYLLKKLDVEGFSKRPDQWRSSQASKESTYKEFYAAFGPKENKKSQSNNFLADSSHRSQPETLKNMRNEIDTFLSSGMTHQSSNKFKKLVKKRLRENSGFLGDEVNGDSVEVKNGRSRPENTDAFKSLNVKNDKKRYRKN